MKASRREMFALLGLYFIDKIIKTTNLFYIDDKKVQTFWTVAPTERDFTHSKFGLIP